MKDSLLNKLAEMDDVDFLTLEHYVNISRMVRDCMSKHNISHSTMAARLEVPEICMDSVLNAAYPFDLRFLARLQGFSMELAAKEAKFKVEAKEMGIPVYKDHIPKLCKDIEALLKKADALTEILSKGKPE